MKGILKFFRDAAGELDHVAWPTPVETKRYFAVTVGLMAAAGVALFLALSFFSWALFSAKDAVNPASPSLPAGKNAVLPDLPSLSLSGASFSAEAPIKK